MLNHPELVSYGPCFLWSSVIRPPRTDVKLLRSPGSLCCTMVRAFSVEGKNAIQPTSVKVLMAGSECTTENGNFEN